MSLVISQNVFMISFIMKQRNRCMHDRGGMMVWGRNMLPMYICIVIHHYVTLPAYHRCKNDKIMHTCEDNSNHTGWTPNVERLLMSMWSYSFIIISVEISGTPRYLVHWTTGKPMYTSTFFRLFHTRYWYRSISFQYTSYRYDRYSTDVTE